MVDDDRLVGVVALASEGADETERHIATVVAGVVGVEIRTEEMT